ncbi:MAG: class I SAM-dependent methyltransferase [Cyanobacteria bacterium P01_G01_bin.39]
MECKLNISSLEPASETLLATVYLRSLESKMRQGIIKDDKSIEIINRINYNFSKYDCPINQALIAIRTKIIDKFVSDFIVQHPHTTVVNLGTGLCTRFFRLDNGLINWDGIDLPIVKPIWHTLLGETERHRYLSYSVLDLDWMKEVKQTRQTKVLFIAEGLLMFLSEIEVRYLLQNIGDNFADSEIIFDSLGILLARNSWRNISTPKVKGLYQWGIKDLSEIETWGRKIELVNQWHYLDQYKTRLGWVGLVSYLPLFRRQVKIGHLRFT